MGEKDMLKYLYLKAKFRYYDILLYYYKNIFIIFIFSLIYCLYVL